MCQINREGKLELKAYGAEPVVTMEAKHRFSSSYSDFVTRYTAVYSTNEIDAISEYYCLEPDDGLTMNLGVNPLLQYGLVNTREVIVTNILNAISVINYVPFDSDTIGNPALEPMDVVKFTGCHADDDSISCITSALFIGNINCVVSAEEETVSKEYTVSHEVSMVDSIIARAVAIAKDEIASGGELVIAPANCKAAVAGSGIASGYTEWDGKIVIEQQIPVLSLPDAVVIMKGLIGDVECTLRTDMEAGTASAICLNFCARL